MGLAVDGRDGSTLFDLTTPILRLSGLAVADLDGERIAPIHGMDVRGDAGGRLAFRKGAAS